MKIADHDVLRLPFIAEYDGPRPLNDMDDVQRELGTIMEVVNKNNNSFFRTHRSIQNYFEEAVDDEKMPRVQHHDKHFEKHSIHGASLERGMKNFITDIMFRIVFAALNWRLQWAQNGVGGVASNIYWPDSGRIESIPAGNAVLSGSVSNADYAYIDPRAGNYSVQVASTGASPARIREAQADGRICLCRAVSSLTRAVGWRHVAWGGGRDLK